MKGRGILMISKAFMLKQLLHLSDLDKRLRIAMHSNDSELVKDLSNKIIIVVESLDLTTIINTIKESNKLAS